MPVIYTQGMWYYLNARNEILGPFSLNDIQSLLARGILTGETLIAQEGDDNWFPLERLIQPANALPAVPQKKLGQCPHCHAMLVGEPVPARCPCCNKSLHPGTMTLGGNAWYAFTQMFNFRGRATRREYWSYFLILSLSLIAVQIITCLIIGIGVSLNLEKGDKLYEVFTDPDIASELVLYGLFIVIVIILMLFAGIAAIVRRLHDTGRSGYALFLYCIVCVLIPLFGSYDSQANAILIFLVFASIIIRLYILVCLLMPSKPGPNKYGPCLLFPHRR